ncbi:MAG: hypothetical protein ACKV1O_23595 [Saprospiraceae bacterium]
MPNEKKDLFDFEETLETSLENSNKVKKFNLDDLTHIKGGVAASSTASSAIILVLDCW